MLDGNFPERAERGRYAAPWVHEIAGRTFLDERQQIARAVYAGFEPYREWTHEKIAEGLRAECRRKLAHSHAEGVDHDALAAQIEMVVALRLEALHPEEIARKLAAWHRDLPARELALGIERRQAERLLAGAADAPGEARALGLAWPRLFGWLRPPGRVRITTPLVLAYDPERDVFGLTRVVLPRENSWPASAVPEQPYAIQLACWMLGLGPFASGEDAPATPGADSPLARAVRGYTIGALDYAVEPVPSRVPEPGEVAPPLARHRHRWLLQPATGGEPETLELVTETVFRAPVGWQGEDPLTWSYKRGELTPERLIPRCVVVGGAPGSLARTLVASGVPACP
jgi:hypothetical protein